ncbi:hypothetical protein GIX45_28400 [Erwinia sp. CPCC 100877]|nr:hypothetical protein [Erwinia sp. CPCC 100877]
MTQTYKAGKYYTTSCYYSPYGKNTTFIFKIIGWRGQSIKIVVFDNYLKSFKTCVVNAGKSFINTARLAKYAEIMLFKQVEHLVKKKGMSRAAS